MSLIYEALRKSEQQRRAGEVPKLATDPGWGTRRPPPRRARSRWLWVAAPAAVLGLAVSAWLMRGAWAPNAAAPATDAARSADGPPGAATPAAGDTLPVLASPQDPLTAAAVVAVAPEPRPESPATPSTEAASHHGAEPVGAAASAMLLQEPAPPEPMERAAPGIATSPAPQPPAEAVAAEATLPLVYELPYAVRKSMPKLAVSMHVYNADPARRFAIINDERRAEGADFDGVRVVTIRRDGIELEYGGQRFLVPRTGG